MKRLYYTVFEEENDQLVCGKRMCQINEFKGVVTGHQYDVERTDVEGETAESLYSRDPRRR